MVKLFNSLIYRPILNLLVWIYQNLAFDHLGIAIIILTIIIRFILLPFFYKSSKDQALIRKIQPKVDKIKKKYKDDKEKQAQKLMELYKAYELNPFSGFLLLIIQLPIFIGLFQIFKNSELIIETFSNPTLFNIINLTETSMILVVIAAAVQYFQAKTSLGAQQNTKQKTNNPMGKFGKYMVYIGPVLSFIVLSQLPSALAVYWIISAIFSSIQHIIINKKISKIDFDKKVDLDDNDKEEDKKTVKEINKKNERDSE